MQMNVILVYLCPPGSKPLVCMIVLVLVFSMSLFNWGGGDILWNVGKYLVIVTSEFSYFIWVKHEASDFLRFENKKCLWYHEVFLVRYNVCVQVYLDFIYYTYICFGLYNFKPHLSM